MYQQQGQPPSREPYGNPPNRKIRGLPLRLHRGWNRPQPMRPDSVPDKRPVSVIIAAVLFVAGMVLSSGMFFTSTAMFFTGTATPNTSMSVIIGWGVIGVLLLLMTIGLWNGRETARWLLMRVGIGFGAIMLFGALVTTSLTLGMLADDGAGILAIIAVWMFALSLIATGLMMLLPSVRVWCAGRRR